MDELVEESSHENCMERFLESGCVESVNCKPVDKVNCKPNTWNTREGSEEKEDSRKMQLNSSFCAITIRDKVAPVLERRE
uniref:Uncharacterized protein n=1 Tax=Peronospora matthiolae TaxID=2874970 RepID=A0AAV1UCB1_9STRA